LSVEQLAMQLLRYDAACEIDYFNSSSQTCNICFEQVRAGTCTGFPPTNKPRSREPVNEMLHGAPLPALRVPAAYPIFYT
jgi:hypothetical protein